MYKHFDALGSVDTLPAPVGRSTSVSKLAPRVFGAGDEPNGGQSNGKPRRVGSNRELARIRLQWALRPEGHVRIFLPSHDVHGRPLPPDQSRKVVTDALDSVSGGGSNLRPPSRNGDGWFKNGAGIQMREPVEVAESFLPETLTFGEAELLATELANAAVELSQCELLVAVDGKPYRLPGVDVDPEPEGE